jgi:hypothetical protein
MDKKKIAISIGLLATIGVTGLAFQYRKEIIGLIKGKKIVSSKAVSLAEKEKKKWGNGNIKEHDPKTLKELKDYWKSVGLTYEGMKNEAWSAAFISYIMKKAGAKDSFKYSPSHSVYIVDAIKNKKENKGSWKGYKPEEVRVAKGDLVCYARQNGVSYDTTNRYLSHCDIVNNIDKKNGFITAIGGNVSDSVRESKYDISKEGIVTDRKIFVVIKNK